MKIRAILAIAAFGLVGCKSTPEVIEPRPLDTNASYAFNVANQTVLTRNDSPLRDFTLDEVEEIQLSRPDGGDASLFFGTLSILTGDLTGAISVAGGTAANIANSKHQSAYSRWVVSAPRERFSNEVEFQLYVRDEIVAANIEALEELTGNSVTLVEREYLHKYQINGVDSGWAYRNVMNDSNKSKAIGNIKNGEGSELYTYGYKPKALDLGNYAFIDLTRAISSYSDYFKLVTSKLPQGFYYYSTSYPKAWAKDSKLYNVLEPVPAIYTQGKKYEFIKPEAAQ